MTRALEVMTTFTSRATCPRRIWWQALALSLLLGFLPRTAPATDEPPGNRATIGNPAEPEKLPAALLAAYAGGAREITISPGTYMIPPTGRGAIALVGWKEARIRAEGVTLVFEELAHRPFILQRCEGVTLEGAVLRFASPAFTQGRIVAPGRDDRGDYLDWQIDAGYSVNLDPANQWCISTAARVAQCAA